MVTRKELHERIESVDLYEWAWSIDSMPPEYHDALSQVLVEWVIDYNRNFVVRESQLIPWCWPAHPGLAREIAATYAHWMHVFHSAGGSAEGATAFYDRTLPGFQDRVPRWLGAHGDACRAGNHAGDWNSLTLKIEDVALRADETRKRLGEQIMPRLAATLSAPQEAPLPDIHDRDMSGDSGIAEQ